MLKSLDERDGEAPSVEVYGGATFRDVGTRLEEESLEGQTMLRRRLRLNPEPDFTSHRFKELCIAIESTGDDVVDHTSLWHAHPELWDLEILLIRCLGQVS